MRLRRFLRFLVRWTANAFAFFFGLYLLDTLMAPHFYLSRLWIAFLLAALLGAANSLNRPFRGYSKNRRRAFGFFGLTTLANYIALQVVVIVSPMSGNPIAMMFAAVFLVLLAAAMNHLVGFVSKHKPKIVTREHGIKDSTQERPARYYDRRPKKRARKRRDRTKSGTSA